MFFEGYYGVLVDVSVFFVNVFFLVEMWIKMLGGGYQGFFVIDEMKE